jgi:hypothetical protein
VQRLGSSGKQRRRGAELHTQVRCVIRRSGQDQSLSPPSFSVATASTESQEWLRLAFSLVSRCPAKGGRGAKDRQIPTPLLFGTRCRRQIHNRARIRTRGLCAKRSLGSGTGMLVVCRPSNAHDKFRCLGTGAATPAASYKPSAQSQPDRQFVMVGAAGNASISGGAKILLCARAHVTWPHRDYGR